MINYPTVSFIIPHLGTSKTRIEGLADCILSIHGLYYPHHKVDIHVIEGPETVPQKVQKGVEQSSGELIVYAANDFKFLPESIINAISDMREHNKGLVSFNSGPLYPDRGNACEHFIIKREFLPQLENGLIFHTDMSHYGVDNYLMAQAEKLDQFMWSEKSKGEHNHFTTGAGMDEVYQKALSTREKDIEILNKKLAWLSQK